MVDTLLALVKPAIPSLVHFRLDLMNIFTMVVGLINKDFLLVVVGIIEKDLLPRFSNLALQLNLLDIVKMNHFAAYMEVTVHYKLMVSLSQCLGMFMGNKDCFNLPFEKNIYIFF